MTGAQWTSQRRRRSLRERAINEVPREVVDAARAAFDARRPGVDILRLISESGWEASPANGSLFRFGDGRTTVDMTVEAVEPTAGADQIGANVPYPRVDPTGAEQSRPRTEAPRLGLLRVTVSVSPASEVRLELDHLEPSLRLVMTGPFPVTFEGVQPGVVTLVAEAGGQRVWRTAWTRLQLPS